MIFERGARYFGRVDRGGHPDFEHGRERRQRWCQSCRRVKYRHTDRTKVGARADLRLRLMAGATRIVNVRSPGQLHKHQQRRGNDSQD